MKRKIKKWNPDFKKSKTSIEELILDLIPEIKHLILEFYLEHKCEFCIHENKYSIGFVNKYPEKKHYWLVNLKSGAKSETGNVYKC